MTKHSQTNIEKLVDKEINYYNSVISLIASESILMPWIKNCLSSELHARTIEGRVGSRYYPGVEHIDKIELESEKLFCDVFKMKYANLQPHSASISNLAVIHSSVPHNSKILSMSLKSGGHISHGLVNGLVRNNYEVIEYNLDSNCQIDFNHIEDLVNKHKPKLIISGSSSFPRNIEHNIFSEISKNNNIFHLADIAHTAGLFAADILPKNYLNADFVTLSTQKTLLGPRGGVILVNDNNLSEIVSKTLFPGIQGALMNNVIAAKGLCIEYTKSDAYKNLMTKVVESARLLANTFLEEGIPVYTNGTDTHIILLDLKKFNLNLKKLTQDLSTFGILTNFNWGPNDDKNSGPNALRLGTTIVAQMGVENNDIKKLAKVLSKFIISNGKSYSELINITKEINAIYKNFRSTQDIYNYNNYKNYNIYVPSDLLSKDLKLRSNESNYFHSKSVLFNKEDKLFCKEDIALKYFAQNFDASINQKEYLIFIPCLNDFKFLQMILEYIRKLLPNSDILIVEAGDNIFSEKIAKEYKCYWVNEQKFIHQNLDIYSISKTYKYPIDNFKGKGIAHLIARIFLEKNGYNKMILLDADIENIESLNPLGKLLGAYIFFESNNHIPQHLMLGTPNRKNDGLHACLEGFMTNISNEILKNIKGEKYYDIFTELNDIVLNRNNTEVRKLVTKLNKKSKNLALIYIHLSPLIHLLTGERLIDKELLRQLPCINNSLETLINIISAEENIATYQVGNLSLLEDSKNSYEKNETMLIACQKLLQNRCNGKAFREWDEIDYINFNLFSTTTNTIRILPQNTNCSINEISSQPDFLLPPLTTLIEKGFINPNIKF
jgi:glycine hydroxymethyltransferase